MAKKKQKMPKKPKMTSSMDIWKGWEKRAAKVKAYNDAIDRERALKQKISNRF